MPEDAGIVRIHSAGDFFSQIYFDAWLSVVHSFPQTLFYAYTKALPYWLRRRDVLPANLSLTASFGGRCDHLISENNLKSAIVVENEEMALDMGLEVDYTDEHAAVGRDSFALVIHGIQPKKER